jgi:HEAT repeat protein
LPLALLSINAQLAVRAAEQETLPEADRHLQLMRVAGFDQSALDEATRQAVEPTRARIKTLCKAAESEADADPIHADTVTQRLVEQTSPLLAVLDCLLPAGNSVRDGVHDEVALGALLCQIPFGNKTENWQVSLALLQLILPIAAGEAARSRIEKNLETVRSNAESGNDWCGEGYYDLPEAVRAALEHAHEQAKARRWDEAIALLVDLLMGRGTVQIEEESLPLVRKPLAYCLNLQSVDLLNRALERLNTTPTIITQARERIGAFGASYLLRHLEECWACGTQLIGQYVKFTYDGIPYQICLSCSTKQDRERTRRKTDLSEAIKSAAQNLFLAQEFDQTNTSIENNFASLRKIAMGVETRVPDAHTLPLRIRLGLVTVDDLVKALKSSDWDARWAAKPVLEKMDPLLSRQLTMERWKRRMVTVSVAAVIPFLVLLTHNFIMFYKGDPETTYSLYRYGLIGREKAVATLATGVQQSQDANLRQTAAEALGRIGPEAKGAITTLVTILTDSDPNIRQAATEALGKIDPDWAASQAAKNERTRITALIETFRSTGMPRATAEALGKLSPDGKKEAVPILVAGLKDNDWRFRQGVVQGLGEIGLSVQEVLPALIVALKDSDSDVRRVAAQALGGPNIAPGAKEAIPALKVALEDSDSGVKKAATEALAAITAQRSDSQGGSQAVRSKSEEFPSLAGIWEDPETGARYTIRKVADELRVASARARDGEVFPILDTTWREGVLRWTYRVPSAGSTVTFTTRALRGDSLECAWNNGSESGRETLQRVSQ